MFSNDIEQEVLERTSRVNSKLASIGKSPIDKPSWDGAINLAVRSVMDAERSDKERVWIKRNGILLLGGCGNGKTTTLKMMNHVANKTREDTFIYIDAIKAEIMAEFKPEELWDIIDNTRNLIIDDVGTETKVMHYGKTYEVFSRIVLLRYSLFVDHGFTLSLSTNLTGEELRSRYKDPTYSRLKGMCNSFSFTGPDLRINK